MSDHTLFLSYASADLAEAEALEDWLKGPPRGFSVWRDRGSIPPGAPAYYASILEGIGASANFLVHLSPRWLRSRVSAQEIADASALGKKIVPVVHAAIPRDPSTPEGRARKNELFEALDGSPAKALLEPINWVWLSLREGEPLEAAPLTEALTTDFDWKRQHTLIVQRLAHWQSAQDSSALVRGAELASLMAAAFSGSPEREPRLTEAQRDFLLASQRQDAAERQRTEALHAGTHARSLAFAARERGEAEPDTALLLASAAATAAAAPEARSALGQLLHRHAGLTRVLHEHGANRPISGLAISPQGHWFASIDRKLAVNDERESQLLVHELHSGNRVSRQAIKGSFTAVAWGQRWLAAATRGSIGWLRWDEWKHRFRGNTPTALGDETAPDFLAFSPPSAGFDCGELLAWGTSWGELGVIRVGDHVHLRTRLAESASSDALTGLAWLADGRLLLAEGGRIVVRHPFALDQARELAAPGRVFSLSCVDNRWVASCATANGHALLFGEGDVVGGFRQVGPPDLAPLATWAGTGPQAEVLIGTRHARAGVGMVSLAGTAGGLSVLLEGEDAPISALAADATGQCIVAGDQLGRVWLWNRTRRSVLVTPSPSENLAPWPPKPARYLAPSPDFDIPADAFQTTTDPRGHHLYALVNGMGLHWKRWRRDAPKEPPETLLVLKWGDPDGDVAFSGLDRVVFVDDKDLVFMPVDAPEAHTLRSAHDNPIKRLVATPDLVASVACSFMDTSVDQLRLWAPTGEPLGLVTLPEHVLDMRIEPDGSRLQVLGASGQTWDVALDLGVWAAHATRMAGRSLTDEERRRFHTDTWRSSLG
jgi:TIR domain